MYDVFAYVPAILAATVAIICMVLIALGALKTVLTGNGR